MNSSDVRKKGGGNKENAKHWSKMAYLCFDNDDLGVRAQTCSPLSRITLSMWATFPIFYGICMEEHTCEARLPHTSGNVVRKRKHLYAQGCDLS